MNKSFLSRDVFIRFHKYKCQCLIGGASWDGALTIDMQTNTHTVILQSPTPPFIVLRLSFIRQSN